MQTHEIRRRFLAHFQRAGHTEVPSASLILADPNLLFVNAGMVPFVPYFLGQRTPPHARATSVQKCVRTIDIDNVGITTRHNTFFQMAGNFSFGDYFKRGAIELAWSLLTGAVAEGGYGFDPQRLWATIYLDDDEAEKLWRQVGVPAEHIQRRGMADNYWSMGIPGPCGPSSEIYFDRGPQYGREGGPIADEDRYLEIWNLVFMENERGGGKGKEDFEVLGPLPKKNIDTGMGIERVAFLLQGVDNVYETDLLRPIIDRTQDLTGRQYGVTHDDDVRFRVVADHIRAAAMLIADGVNPGNDGRGYVLRRLLRRVVRSVRLLGATGPVIRDLITVAAQLLAPSYPELGGSGFGRIETVAVGEESAFLETLATGSRLFDETVTTLRAGGGKTISGSDAFTLHDRYGFPYDLTLEMASEAGLTVDEAGFRELMAEQRQRAKDDAQARKHAHADLSVYRELLDRGPTQFTGFDELATEAKVLALVKDGVRVPAAEVGAEVEVMLDRTPLYAEAGGQLADRGWITAAGLRLPVTDVQKIAKTVWAHTATVESGQIAEGDQVLVQVDPQWRYGATQGHSGTHLVHAALRQVLGPNATQAGSLNRPGYLRFDFRWTGPLSHEQQAQIEAVSNEGVGADYPVNTFVTELETARKMGALALFGENYGDEVRVVEIGGPFSMELCGGTHVQRSAQVGPITVVGQSSVGSGIRRVEALVGLDSFQQLARERALLAGVAASLKVPAEQVPARVEQLVQRLKVAERDVAKARLAQVTASASRFVEQAERAGELLLVAAAAPDGVGAGELRTLATDIRGRFGSEPAVVALLGNAEGKVPFVVAVNEPARARGVAAGELVGSFAAHIGGRGGGRAELAQGAGSEPAGIAAAVAALRARVAELGA